MGILWEVKPIIKLLTVLWPRSILSGLSKEVLYLKFKEQQFCCKSNFGDNPPVQDSNPGHPQDMVSLPSGRIFSALKFWKLTTLKQIKHWDLQCLLRKFWISYKIHHWLIVLAAFLRQVLFSHSYPILKVVKTY